MTTDLPDTGETKAARNRLAFRAIAEGSVNALQSYIERGIDTEARNASDETMLVYALQRGRQRMAKLLLDHGAGIDAQGSDRRTPLMLSLAQGFNDVARDLLAKGADTTLTDKFGATALAIVKASGNPAGAQLLFARMDAQDLHMQAIWAIREGDLDSLKYLVETKGVKLTGEGPDGLRPTDEMALWMGGEVADYVSLATADENASLLGKGVGGPGVAAPAKAKFSKKGTRPAP